MNEIIAHIGELGGWTVAIVGYIIVFFALVLMIFIFSVIPKLINLQLKFELRKKGKVVESDSDEFTVGGDISAAISMALHLYLNELHDEESKVITINRTTRRYSPWSSKIYSIYNTPVK